MNGNEDFQKIIDFADGNLDPSQEDELFLKLSADVELREELKSHMAVKNAVRTGILGLSVPIAAKTAIFTKLGLSIPTATTIVGSGAAAGIIAYLTRKKITVAAGLLVGLTALFITWLFLPNESDIPKSHQQESFTVGNNIKSAYPEIPNVSSKEIITQNKAKSATKQKHSSKFNSFNDIQPNTNIAELPLENTTEPFDFDRLIIANSYGYLQNINPTLLLNNSQSHFGIPTTSYNPYTSDNETQFSIEFRGMNYLSTSKPTIEPNRYSPLNNLGLSLLYNVNENLSVGADFRAETFFLRYEGTESGLNYIYEQQPNFTTISAIVRYKLDGWSGLQPFSQLNLGINSIGLVSRAMLGIEYEILPSISLILSTDFNHLIYSHQNNYFQSSKFGLNYGLSYSF